MNMSSINWVIPAAGYGTRLGAPFSKELTLIPGGETGVEPIIARHVRYIAKTNAYEEQRDGKHIGAISGDTVTLVTRRNKNDLNRYWTEVLSLYLERRGIRTRRLYQDHAANSLLEACTIPYRSLGPKRYGGEDSVFAVLLPDSVWSGASEGFQYDMREDTSSHAGALCFWSDNAGQLGKVEFPDGNHSVDVQYSGSVYDKPGTGAGWAWGVPWFRGFVINEVLESCKGLEKACVTHLLDYCASSERTAFRKTPGRYIDIGTPEGLLSAYEYLMAPSRVAELA